MSSAVRKTIREIKKRDEVKAKALEKGWRSRWTVLFKAWASGNRGSHLEWLGYYDEAAKVREKYGFSPKDVLKFGTEVTSGMLTGLVNSELASGGIYDSSNNVIYTGHIENRVGYSTVFRMFRAMFYTSAEQTAIIFGKYKTDAFGLPVCWTKPKNK